MIRFDNLKLKSKLLLIFTSINLLATLLYSIYIYDLKSDAIIKEIDARLVSAVHATPRMLPKHYVEFTLSQEPLSDDEYREYVSDLYAYCKSAGLKYVYLFIQRDNKILYLMDSASQEDIAKGNYGNLYASYDTAPPELYKSFKDGESRYAEYTDQFGYFRSLFLPIKLPNGRVYIIGADVEITYVKNELTKALSVSIALGMFVFAIGFVVSLLIIRHFTTPVLKMLEYTHRITHQDYSVPLDVQSSENEFGQLATSLQIMALHIESREKTLELKLLSSIEYASTIQNAILPHDKTLRYYFSDIFTLWQPKDIVGGDIYLFEEIIEGECGLLFFADCTGHGVGGSFVTMIIKSIMMQITAEFSEFYIRCVENDSQHFFDLNPSEILQNFNRILKSMFNQYIDSENKTHHVDVGFDGAVLYYNKQQGILKFAGAKTDLYMIDNHELKVIKGDKESIGYKKSSIYYKFTDYVFDINEDYSPLCYITTDGYLDQIGGDKEFPFGKKRFSQMLLDNHHRPLEQQKEVFKQINQEWRKDYEQNDDICIIGFKCA